MRGTRLFPRLSVSVCAILCIAGAVRAEDESARRPAAGGGQARHRSFAQTVSEHFTRWDTNHDGRLDSHEIDEAIRRRNVHGPAAAALATIKTRERQALAASANGFAETEAELTAEGRGPAQQLDEARGEAKPFRPEAVFSKHLRSLANINRRLFAGDEPNFALMHQGAIGDCFFFSVVGNLAAHQPDRIRRMIAENEGSYLVRFGDGQEVKVPAPTDVEIIVNNSRYSIEDGIWLTVLEKAVGQRLEATSKSASAEETDAISHGGSSRKIIGMLTGKQTQLISLRDRQHEAERLEQLRRTVPKALAAHRLVAVSMGKEPPEGHKKIPGLGYHHVYALFGIDRESDRVKLWNPWGNDFSPKGQPGIQHGFETRHGIFHVPLKTLYNQFSGVVIETTKPLEPAAPRAPAEPK